MMEIIATFIRETKTQYITTNLLLQSIGKSRMKSLSIFSFIVFVRLNVLFKYVAFWVLKKKLSSLLDLEKETSSSSKVKSYSCKSHSSLQCPLTRRLLLPSQVKIPFTEIIFVAHTVISMCFQSLNIDLKWNQILSGRP